MAPFGRPAGPASRLGCPESSEETVSGAHGTAHEVEHVLSVHRVYPEEGRGQSLGCKPSGWALRSPPPMSQTCPAPRLPGPLKSPFRMMDPRSGPCVLLSSSLVSRPGLGSRKSGSARGCWWPRLTFTPAAHPCASMASGEARRQTSTPPGSLWSGLLPHH